MSKTLIIGGVAGGASAAARLRRLDESAEIVILERGEYISYANCGLPYYIGDAIKSRDALLLQTPEAMKEKYNIDVRVKNEVISIDKENKSVSVRITDTDEVYTETYDQLVISTGSSPLRPPIPGIDSKRIDTLWTIPDTDRISKKINEEDIKTAAVIGGGFIGLEMAENLHNKGIEVSIVEMLDQVMAPIDYEMAQLLHENISMNGVNLLLGDGVKSFKDEADGVKITLNSGKELNVDFVILSIGVKPNGELAKDAGLKINERGGIIVDEYLKTSDPNIYAVGDVIEVNDFVLGEKTMVPLAGPANKQGRIVANNIAASDSQNPDALEKYVGTQGTSIAQVFDLTAASTGLSEKALNKNGLTKNVDYETIIINQNSHAGYYPGAVPLTIKLIFSTDGKKIYGAQIVGSDGVDKRIDTIATTVRLGGGINELKELELAYAPPYSSAKDPVNMAGFTAENVLTDKVKFCRWDELENNPDAVILDIRESAELMAFTIPNAIHIPLGQLRHRIGELKQFKNKPIIPFCAIGVRSYNAARTLMNNGFSDVRLYPGGTKFYQSTHYKDYVIDETNGGVGSPGGSSTKSRSLSSGSNENADNNPTISIRLDCSGMQCPGPIMKVFETMKDMNDGEVMEVSASDPGFTRDIGAWARRTGNTLMTTGKKGSDYTAVVKKGLDISNQPLPQSSGMAGASVNRASGAVTTTSSMPNAIAGNNGVQTIDTNDGKTMIVFSGDLDKVLASFIIANGAAAMGRPVTMFFTFWGLNALRKADKQPVKKSFMEKMFGAMLPRGSKKLKLSNMNMGGMGTAMMKKIMKDKNVDSLEELMKSAMNQGVKIVACTMSMDVMGIKEEELIEGVELGGVGAYLGDAEESNVNLFI